MMPYRVQIRAGAHSWDIDEGDAPAFGPLADLLIGWEADLDYQVDDSGPRSVLPGGPYTNGDDYAGGFPSQLKPWRARLGIITTTAGEVGDLAVDDPVWIRYRHTSAGAVAVEFTGRIRELTQNPHERGAVTWLVCGDYTLDAQSATFDPGVGFDAWLTTMDLTARLAKVHDNSPFSTQPVWTGVLSSGALASPDYPGPVYTAARALWGAAGNLFTYTIDAAGVIVKYAGLPFVNGTFGSPLRMDAAGVITGGIDACDIARDDIEWRRTWVDLTDEELPYSGTTPAGWDIASIVYRNPDPAVMAGWFTLPDAMSQLVAVSGIDPKWHPESRTYWGGRPVAAEFRILPGGDRTVTLKLTRRMPDPSTTWPISATADNPDAITWAELPVGLAWNELPVGLSWDDLDLIGA